MKNNGLTRLFSVILALALMFMTMPFSAITVNAITNEFAGGSGTENDPYLISNKYHLNNVRNDLDAHYKMVADIVFTNEDFIIGGDFYNNGIGWSPIGDDTTYFTGTFNGNEHTINNLKIQLDATGSVFAGLFGYCHGTIFDLTLTDVSITGTVTGENSIVYAGGICAYISAGVVKNCTVSGTVLAQENCVESIDKAKAYAGGIVGYSDNGTIIDCINSAKVSAISDSRATSSGGGSWATYANAGGITSRTTGIIYNSYNRGEINSIAKGNYAYSSSGGITARSDKDISCCYNTGNVSALGNPNNIAGGIAANYSQGTISNCYNTGAITSDGDVGGAVGYFSSGNISCFYNIGNLCRGNSYHYLGGVIG